MNNKYYITTPIYYVNARPHIGHTYTTIAADVLARYHRMVGDKTFFLTGTDEHGAKIEEKAREEGKNVKEFVDEVANTFKKAWKEINISNDAFLRTTNPKHMKAVQNALQYMYDKGDIYKGEYSGLYCRGCEQFKTENDLINGLCPDHKTEPERMSEETYMFKMSKYSDELLEKIKNDKIKIRPIEKKNEILSFMKDGLSDISFSRKNVKWGIPLPWDETHTAYVWSDAFLNYLTGIGWEGPDSPQPEMWPANLQLMAKDILRVHSTIWQAMLLSLDVETSQEIFIHGYFLVDGQKMSKSLGNVISPEALNEKYGVDAVRYLLMSATTFGRDGDIGWDKFDEKYNADLANGIGNLLSRTISMIDKYFNGLIPSDSREEEVPIPAIIDPELDREGPWEEGRIIGKEKYLFKQYMKNNEIDKALACVIKSTSNLDAYISYYKPFKLIKEDEGKTAAVLYICAESLRALAWMLLPFMPTTSKKIWESLGLSTDEEEQKIFENAIVWGGLTPGLKTKKIDGLFPRIT